MHNSELSIANRQIGPGHPCFVIAEVAQAHDGSLGIAHSFIDAVADAGADAVKFQTHIADAESTCEEAFRVNFSYEDVTRFDYWRRMEFTQDQWLELARHAEERGLVFLSSPFSVEAVHLLEKIGTPAWKIGSGEVNNPLLFEAMIQTGKPILLSTGMSNWSEIAGTVQKIRSQKASLAALQCTSQYPTPLTDVGLNVMRELRDRFNIPVGLSDHSGSVYPALAALAQGADIVEVHVTFHRSMFGPDVPASVTIEELRAIADARNAFHTMATHPVDKDQKADELAHMRSLFNKSVALKRDLPAGAILTAEALTTKKPGTGIPAENISSCIGKTLRVDKSADNLLSMDDLI